jgi:hypothetical protein
MGKNSVKAQLSKTAKWCGKLIPLIAGLLTAVLRSLELLVLNSPHPCLAALDFPSPFTERGARGEVNLMDIAQPARKML